MSLWRSHYLWISPKTSHSYKRTTQTIPDQNGINHSNKETSLLPSHSTGSTTTKLTVLDSQCLSERCLVSNTNSQVISQWRQASKPTCCCQAHQIRGWHSKLWEISTQPRAGTETVLEALSCLVSTHTHSDHLKRFCSSWETGHKIKESCSYKILQEGQNTLCFLEDALCTLNGNFKIPVNSSRDEVSWWNGEKH